MKTTLVIALIGWAVATALRAQSPAASADRQLLVQDKFLSVYVERNLYKKPESKGFFVHIRISNKTKEIFGVDLRDRFKMIYPNQWGIHAEPHRGQIDEERLELSPFDPELTEKLMADFRTGELTPVGEHLDYYREFFGASPKDTAPESGHYLIVSMDGHLFFTNGKTVDILSLEWKNGTTNRETDLVIPLPLEWKPLPSGAKVFED